MRIFENDMKMISLITKKYSGDFIFVITMMFRWLTSSRIHVQQNENACVEDTVMLLRHHTQRGHKFLICIIE